MSEIYDIVLVVVCKDLNLFRVWWCLKCVNLCFKMAVNLVFECNCMRSLVCISISLLGDIEVLKFEFFNM